MVAGPSTGWRHRARLAVRGRAASPKIGLFREGTHDVVDVPRCLVHHPLVNRTAAAVKAAIRFALFPFTAHVETLALFARRASAPRP